MNNPVEESQLELFELEAVPALPEVLATMHRLYGCITNAECGYCIAFLRHRKPRYTNCAEFKALGGHNNDWHASWPACGRYTDARA